MGLLGFSHHFRVHPHIQQYQVATVILGALGSHPSYHATLEAYDFLQLPVPQLVTPLIPAVAVA